MKLCTQSGKILANDVEIADNIISRTLGLMFRRSLPDDCALLFILDTPRFVDVHMLFVPFDICIAFLDENKKISKTELLKSWSGKASCNNVKFVVEMCTDKKRALKVGEKISFRKKKEWDELSHLSEHPHDDHNTCKQHQYCCTNDHKQ